MKVVTFGAQKGGTGKSLSAAHFAQYVNLHYGLRVGVIDADPQATVSLYFADEQLPLFEPDTLTLADFMGVDDPAAVSIEARTGEELNDIWQATPWPGLHRPRRVRRLGPRAFLVLRQEFSRCRYQLPEQGWIAG